MQEPVGPELEVGQGHISPSTNATQALSSTPRGQEMWEGLGRSSLRNEKVGLVGPRSRAREEAATEVWPRQGEGKAAGGQRALCWQAHTLDQGE